MKKSNRRIVIKESSQLQQSANFAVTVWLVSFISRHFINHQQSKRLMLLDIFTVNETITLSNGKVLPTYMNYLVCGVTPTVVTIMPLDSVDNEPFKVARKVLKRKISKDM